MGWTKDTQSESPKVVYIPDQNGPVGCTKVVYDPNAPAGQKITAHFDYLTRVDETLAELETALGLLPP